MLGLFLPPIPCLRVSGATQGWVCCWRNRLPELTVLTQEPGKMPFLENELDECCFWIGNILNIYLFIYIVHAHSRRGKGGGRGRKSQADSEARRRAQSHDPKMMT